MCIRGNDPRITGTDKLGASSYYSGHHNIHIKRDVFTLFKYDNLESVKEIRGINDFEKNNVQVNLNSTVYVLYCWSDNKSPTYCEQCNSLRKLNY